MKRFKLILAMVLSMSFANSASAGCWMQCVGVKVNGHCYGGKTKMCNWAGWENDMNSVGKSLNDFTVKLDVEWKKLYRNNLPNNVRDVINTTAVLFSGAYLLGVTPQTVGGALVLIGGRAVIRGQQGKSIHSPESPWITELEQKGNALITSYESAIAVTHKDAESIFRSEIDSRGIYTPTFLNCLTSSTSRSQALLDCYMPLDETLFNLKKEVTFQVLTSEI